MIHFIIKTVDGTKTLISRGACALFCDDNNSLTYPRIYMVWQLVVSGCNNSIGVVYTLTLAAQEHLHPLRIKFNRFASLILFFPRDTTIRTTYPDNHHHPPVPR